MAEIVAEDLTDDDLPELSALLAVSAPTARSRAEALRRSPRKAQQPDNTLEEPLRLRKSYAASTASFAAKQKQTNAGPVPAKQSRASRAEKAALRATRASNSTRPEPSVIPLQIRDDACEPTSRTILGEIPVLPRGRTAEYDLGLQNVITVSATSNNRLSPKYRQPSGLKLTHVDSLLLPLSKMAVSHAHEDSEDEIREPRDRRKSPRKPTKTKAGYASTSKFVLKEARCNDDSQDSEGALDDDDEDTDLSGFIVDDAAELSFHDSPESASDSDSGRIERKKTIKSTTKRQLKRGSPTRQTLSDQEDDSETGGGSNKENEFTRRDDDDLDIALRDMYLGQVNGVNTGATTSTSKRVHVIDLTSPVKNDTSKIGRSLDLPGIQHSTTMSKTSRSLFRSPVTNDDSNAFGEDFDAILKFSPPGRYSPTKKSAAETKLKTSFFGSEELISARDDEEVPSEPTFSESRKSQNHSKTPPATPPRTPTKPKSGLRSPSKLFSPSKKQVVPDSPHRQSVDGFWDLEVVNTWNDTYSPKKAPLTSPRKLLDRFKIWEDSDDEASCIDSADNEVSNTSGDSSSLPSPCSSPTKRHASPVKTKAPRSPTKVKPKNLEKEAKKLFNARKESLAQTLLTDLDANVTSNKLQSLAASTGGVKITWSKTLRSTAGRANWRRTVTKPGSESPVKTTTAGASVDGGAKVAHYATIELAEKIIDTEERLVNTLAHEFCHLANFMVSGVRDQPHGREFKAWAAKVTKFLREDGRRKGDSVRRAIEVTTKHAYVIDYKYLWVCVGRQQSEAQKYLGLQGDGGCGGEYGRHSRSIDVEKQRCGRCKGLLMQVRPRPRAGSPSKKDTGKGKMKGEGRGEREGSSGSNGSNRSLSGLDGRLDVVELSD